jgi:chromosome segregation ATPase
MKIMWETDDGRIFRTKEEALYHADALAEEDDNLTLGELSRRVHAFKVSDEEYAVMRKRNKKLVQDEDGEYLEIEPRTGLEEDDRTPWEQAYLPDRAREIQRDIHAGIPPAQRQIVKLEKAIKLLESDYETLNDLNKKLRAENTKLQNVIDREKHTKGIMGKSIADLKAEVSKLEATVKEQKAKLSTDHVLMTRKFGDLQIKRPYR